MWGCQQSICLMLPIEDSTFSTAYYLPMIQLFCTQIFRAKCLFLSNRRICLVFKSTCKQFGSSNGMEKYISFVHLKKKKRCYFFSEVPLCMKPLVFWQACAFSLSGKICSDLAFERPRLALSYRYLLTQLSRPTSPEIPAVKNPACGCMSYIKP